MIKQELNNDNNICDDSINKNKFIQLFFSSGIRGNPNAVADQKKLTHVVTNLFILKGDLMPLKEQLTLKGHGEFFKSLRQVHLN